MIAGVSVGVILGTTFKVYIAARMGINTYKTVKTIMLKKNNKPLENKKEVLQ